MIGYTLLYAGEDGKSYFRDVEIETPQEIPLGKISEGIPTNMLYFRQSLPTTYDWHPAPQNVFIVYLSGRAKVEASSGEVREFGPGDILYCTDVTGDGHRATIITEGVALLIGQGN